MEDCISLNKLAWYSYKDKIKKVKIEYGVTSIGTGAFSDCKNLHSISIPDSITEINGLAFYNCTELVNINLPDGISKIQTSTFETCSKLKSINIPDSVTNIKESAFANCLSLKNINISDNVENIENGAFYNCKSLKEINVNPNNKYYLSENGILFDINKTSIICCPAGKTGNYTIPDSVKYIEYYSFYGCNLSNIKISDNINSIGKFAFFKCGLLKSITIPSKNVKIYDDTFYGCDSLKEINISPDNKYYTSSDGVLFNKNKTELICCPMGKTGDYIIPNTVKIIKSPGFNCCKKLTSITIPNSVDQINDDAFGFLIDTQTIYSR
ncbi:MAG: leucine-rich repeat domain-containing protein [Candidatus Pseudoruminococcus sp.]|nr:leucine-rich repeat domain-containing protein [Ruminococcus sp.]MDY2782073.1 leucine-rich repeat domain-containing protein [Candidatus Pseudoruminococcus sp.]